MVPLKNLETQNFYKYKFWAPNFIILARTLHSMSEIQKVTINEIPNCLLLLLFLERVKELINMSHKCKCSKAFGNVLVGPDDCV